MSEGDDGYDWHEKGEIVLTECVAKIKDRTKPEIRVVVLAKGEMGRKAEARIEKIEATRKYEWRRRED